MSDENNVSSSQEMSSNVYHHQCQVMFHQQWMSSNVSSSQPMSSNFSSSQPGIINNSSQPGVINNSNMSSNFSQPGTNRLSV